MNVRRIPNRDFMQMCWVVPDLSAAMASWTRQSGVGRFFHFTGVRHENPMYRGKPWQYVGFEAAIAQAGEVQIELVSHTAAGASIFRDLVNDGSTGFHHMATYTEEFDADLEHYSRAGAGIAFSGLMMGHRVYYLDTVATLGFMVELIEVNPVAAGIFAQIRAAAEDWDGSEPVRTLA